VNSDPLVSVLGSLCDIHRCPLYGSELSARPPSLAISLPALLGGLDLGGLTLLALAGRTGGDDDGLLDALQPLYLSPSRRPAKLGIVGCSLSLLRLAGFGGFALLALASASYFTVPTMPTLRPKLRNVARRSFSMAMAFD
jgi:hypothetical protein